MTVRRFIATAVLFASLTAGAAACSTSAMSPSPVGDPPEYTSSASVTVAQPTPTLVRPGRTESNPVRVGTAIVTYDAQGVPLATITVHAVIPWSEEFTSGVAIDAEVALARNFTSTYRATNDVFSAVDAEHHIYTASFMPGPKPAFPAGEAMRAGDSVRGWVLIETAEPVSALTVRAALDQGHLFWKS